MIVTFISECEKKALNRTRRVLDSFANRIGHNAWQTVVTEEGLEAVYKLLKKTATKNTAVSCHRIKSRTRSDLQWVVGNRKKFNMEGNVPVNTTASNQFIAEEMSLPFKAIQSLSVMAALFHDLGKASNAFQNKLKTSGRVDYYRHEWISVVLFASFVGNREDEAWLDDIINNNVHHSLTQLVQNKQSLKECLKECLNTLPPIAQMIAWLILSHHKLPLIEKGPSSLFFSLAKGLEDINAEWGYTNHHSLEKDGENCVVFDNDLPSINPTWQQKIEKGATNIRSDIDALKAYAQNRSSQLILTLARCNLILADHYYSSLNDKEHEFRKNISEQMTIKTSLYANTHKSKMDQPLEEHLIGVAEKCRDNGEKLKAFLSLPTASSKDGLNKKSEGYEWQDTAVKAIKEWRNKHNPKDSFGFFGVNIASTGQGKTIANAKIMQALSSQGKSLRYVLALGLRTLTLQTGDEYRHKIGLQDDELAVIIGSKAIAALHQENTSHDTEIEETNENGSESQELFYQAEEINYNGELDDSLKTFFEKNKKARKMLYAPVLACTIDHIIDATEGIKSGRNVMPTLRLFSSDLVIDEIDDFEPEDLVIIGRIIHLTAMLGRKVLISSATITPSIATGLYQAYQAGWAIYAKTCHINNNQLACFWSDEFTSICQTTDDYVTQHNDFIKSRIKKLEKQAIKRQPYIAKCSNEINDYFPMIQQNIIHLHNHHAFIDAKSGKNISIGVVRMANIRPCIQLTQYLLAYQDEKKEYAIKSMAYHSQQLLIMRNEQEKYLDKILRRKDKKDPAGNPKIVMDERIRQHIDKSDCSNIIFVVVATPVEEVGRDHDFDWAVIEPSSQRSIIQMAGRVYRHRIPTEKQRQHPNIALLQYNYRFLETGENNSYALPFQKPGFQRSKQDFGEKDTLFEKYDLQILTGYPLIEKYQGDFTYPIDSKERIQDQHNNVFVNIEHQLLNTFLLCATKQLKSLNHWIHTYSWISAQAQKEHLFRSMRVDEIYYYYNESFYRKHRYKKDMTQSVRANTDFNLQNPPPLTSTQVNNLWIQRNYEELLKDPQLEKYASQSKDDQLKQLAYTFGEINIKKYDVEDNNNQFYYVPDLGFWREKK